MQKLSPRNDAQPLPVRMWLILLIGLAVLLAVYMLLRYGGRVGENDTAVFTLHIASVFQNETITPLFGAYSNGYGFQALTSMLMHMSGADLPFVQRYLASLLLVWFIIPAWLLYRELTESTRGATIATVLLLIQPEFLFPMLRGTHEKFTRGIMFVCLYLLIRGFRSSDRLSQLAALVVCFYLSTFAAISFNNLMATSFIIAIGMALLLSWLIMREGLFQIQVTGKGKATLQRLGFAVSTCLVLAFLFLFYIYPPALESLRFLGNIGQQTAALVLDVESVDTQNPYTQINTAWITPQIYIILTLSNWLLLIVSAGIWLWLGVRWITRRAQPQSQAHLLLWAFYGAFALQGGLSILADFSGAIGNLQHRVFPSFALLAVPLVTRQLLQWQPQHPRQRQRWFAGFGALVGLFTILAVLKASNEPLLSNKWLFYETGELQAITWSDQALQHKSLWVGLDERLIMGYVSSQGKQPENVQLDVYNILPETRDFLVSDILRNRLQRVRAALPLELDDSVIYDNGQAQIYQHRPDTPYQR